MTREADVVRSLVEMADTLVDDYDVVDLLTGLADRCVNLLGVSAAGVMLASPEGSLGLVASSSEAMRLLELFELQAQEGPCLDAFRTGERVEHENLQAGSGRWPSFSTAALAAGFQSASALPLRLRDADPRRPEPAQRHADPDGRGGCHRRPRLRGPRHSQHRAASCQRRSPAPERAAVWCPDQPGGHRAGQRRDLRARRRRPGRGLLPVAGPTPATATSASPMSPKPPSTAPSIRGHGPCQPVRPPPDLLLPEIVSSASELAV